MRSPLIFLVLGLIACGDKDVVPEDTGPFDDDQDGHYGAADCEPDDPDVYPGAEEDCGDEIDNDCDGIVDEGKTVWFFDYDQDGFGDPDDTEESCSKPGAKYVKNADDCEPANAAANPDAAEICDEIDNDCDGEIDEDDADDAETWYFDFDGDGYGGSAFTVESCAQPDNHSSLSTDCDDTTQAVNPGASEICDDGLDNDCDGTANDCGLSGDLTLDDADAILLGEEEGDDAGFAIAGAGDFNGDGHPDVVVGAPGDDTEGSRLGAAHVLFGPLAGTIDLAYSDLKVTGEATADEAGFAVSGAGDTNGDGYDDILVGAPGGGTTDAGATYLVLGGTSGEYSLHVPTESELEIDPELEGAHAKFGGVSNGDTAGWTVSGNGDVDNDGLSDILVGAWNAGNGAGAAYLITGPVSGDIQLSDAEAKFSGEDDDDRAGISTAMAGDVNGDGYTDILVGAYLNDEEADKAGRAYLILGPREDDVQLGNADTVYSGEESQDYVGYAVSTAGDVDGDGMDDLLIGAPGEDEGGVSAGAVYLINAPADDQVLNLYSAKLLGPAREVYAGSMVATAGDVNNDGHADILVGSGGGVTENDLVDEDNLSDPQGYTGAAYLLYGPLTGVVQISEADARVKGTGKDGYAVGNVGDMDGDANDDIVVGVVDDFNGSNAGAAYIFLGSGL